jgi:hypothetical protein
LNFNLLIIDASEETFYLDSKGLTGISKKEEKEIMPIYKSILPF